MVNQDLEQNIMIFKSKTLQQSKKKEKLKKIKSRELLEKSLKIEEFSHKDLEIEREKKLFKNKKSSSHQENEINEDDPDGVFYLPKIRT